MKLTNLSIHPVFNLQSWYAFEMFDVVCDNSQLLANCLASNNHIEFINSLHLQNCILCYVQPMNGFLAKYVFSLLPTSHLHSVMPEVPSAIFRHFYAVHCVQALLARPNAQPTISCCLGSSLSACEECSQVKGLYSYSM